MSEPEYVPEYAFVCTLCYEVFYTEEEAEEHLLAEHYYKVLDDWIINYLKNLEKGVEDVNRFYEDGKCVFCSQKIPDKERVSHTLDMHIVEVIDELEEDFERGKYNADELISDYFTGVETDTWD